MQKARLVVGAALVLLVLILNPWVMAPLLLDDTELWPVTRQLLLVFDAIFLALGGYILVMKNRPAKTVRGMYADVALMTLNGLLAFFVVNVLAALWLQSKADDAPNAERHFHQPRHKLRDDPEFMNKLYPGLSLEQIAEVTHTPNVIAHPTIEFTERPVKSEFYNVGFENMRYTGFVNEANAEEKINGSVWVLSGSTGFGHGVADDQSLVHYLDELDADATYINFAFQGAMQHNEIDKVLLLLKKGYRPKHIIFLDGLNDTISCLGTNFAPEEITRFPWTAYGYTYNIKAYYQQKSMFGIVGELPIGHVLEQWRSGLGPEVVHISNGYSRTDDPNDLFVTNPRAHFAKTDYMYVNKVEHLDLYKKKILDYYRANLELIQRLAFAYRFRATVVFQPNGMILDTNPFIKDVEAYKKEEIHQLLAGMYAAVREALRDRKIPPMVDLSDLHDGCTDCYVDLAHYHPSFNKKLAAAILEATTIRPIVPPPTEP
ncbi:MAG: hypothetical protein RIT81_35105 [Deltaproteobacteria bacterium]